METIERVKYFQKLLEQGIRNGALRLPSPLGDLRIPDNVIVTNVSFQGKYLQALRNPEEAEQFLQYATKGIKSLREYLNGARFSTLDEGNIELKLPEFAFTTNKDGLSAPRMDNFYYEPRVVIHPVREMEELFKIEGISYYGCGEVPFSVLKKMPKSLEFNEARYHTDIRGVKMHYKTDSQKGVKQKIKLDIAVRVERYPIIFNADLDNLLHAIDKFAVLATAVLYCHLEPGKVKRIEARIKKQGYDISQEQLDKIVNEEVKRSFLICTAVSEDWLMKRKSHESFTKQEVQEFINSANIPKKNPKQYLLIKRMLDRKGPKKTLELLCYST